MESIHSQIVSLIWNIADDVLRDVFLRGQYRDVILPMAVLRRLDALLEPTKNEVEEELKMQKEMGIEDEDAIMKAYNAAAQSSDNVMTGITNAIPDARNSKIKVSLNDKAKQQVIQQLKQRENAAVSDFDKSLTRHKGQLNEFFIKQWKELDDIPPLYRRRSS